MLSTAKYALCAMLFVVVLSLTFPSPAQADGRRGKRPAAVAKGYYVGPGYGYYYAPRYYGPRYYRVPGYYYSPYVIPRFGYYGTPGHGLLPGYYGYGMPAYRYYGVSGTFDRW